MRRRAPVASGFLLLVLGVVGLTGCADPNDTGPQCRADARLGILAQAVPTATRVPCVVQLPVGWSVSGVDVESGDAEFWLASDRAGTHAVHVTLSERCRPKGTEVPPPYPDVQRWRLSREIEPAVAETIFDVFEGGCVTRSYSFERPGHVALISDVDRALALFPRSVLAAELRRETGLDLDPS